MMPHPPTILGPCFVLFHGALHSYVCLNSLLMNKFFPDFTFIPDLQVNTFYMHEKGTFQTKFSGTVSAPVIFSLTVYT